jgi:hypothetical protein
MLCNLVLRRWRSRAVPDGPSLFGWVATHVDRRIGAYFLLATLALLLFQPVAAVTLQGSRFGDCNDSDDRLQAWLQPRPGRFLVVSNQRQQQANAQTKEPVIRLSYSYRLGPQVYFDIISHRIASRVAPLES